MAKFVLRRGFHRASPLSFGIFVGKDIMKRSVTFTDSCRYDLGNANQEDWNKLFGVGYLWSHHDNSARFGWRYNKQKDCIEIGTYCYIDGQRIMDYICDVSIGKEYIMILKITEDYYSFEVIDTESQPSKIRYTPKWHNKLFSYPLGLYFGGDEVAPHDITVIITKM